jgi:KDO2-lipid IV(A) lauroyltransferase
MISKIFSYINYGLIWFISILPLWFLYIISDFLFFVLYRVVGYRRKVVDTNLRNSFPEKSSEELRVIRKRFYHHLCDLFVETFKFWNMSEKSIKKRCRFNNPDVFDKYFDEGKSVMVVLGHYCNWEWLGSFSLWNDRPVFLPIYKPLHNKVMDKMYYNIRSSFGALPLAKNDTLRTMLKYKREGKPTLTCFIADQTPNRHNLNYWTEFLNQDTPVLVGTGRIAKKLDQVVVYAHMKKIKRGYYEVDMFPICEDSRNTDEGEITERHTRALEKIIRETPEYWLWSHKRWKHKRPV